MKREITKYGNPVLRQKSTPIKTVTDEIRRLADDMIETMRAAEGCGLAAQQIGETRAICVIALPPDLDKDEAGMPQHPNLQMPLVVINPEITAASKKTAGREEGCLSFPDIRGSILRHTEITLKFTGIDGTPREEKLRDFAARVIVGDRGPCRQRRGTIARRTAGGRLEIVTRAVRLALAGAGAHGVTV